MVGDQGLPGVRVQDEKKKKAVRTHTHTHSLALNSVSLFSDLSKMKNNATRTPILAVIGFADS